MAILQFTIQSALSKINRLRDFLSKVPFEFPGTVEFHACACHFTHPHLQINAVRCCSMTAAHNWVVYAGVWGAMWLTLDSVTRSSSPWKYPMFYITGQKTLAWTKLPTQWDHGEWRHSYQCARYKSSVPTWNHGWRTQQYFPRLWQPDSQNLHLNLDRTTTVNQLPRFYETTDKGS